MTEKKSTKTSAKPTTKPRGSSSKFTAEERAAMKERSKELKAEAERADGEEALRAAIAKMQGKDRAMAKRVHAVVTASAPDLSPKTWYGMPAYAKDGQVLCFFKNAGKFKTRYSTFGFTDVAKLDQGNLWPTEFALMELTAADEAKLGALVKKAVG